VADGGAGTGRGQQMSSGRGHPPDRNSRAPGLEVKTPADSGIPHLPGHRGLMSAIRGHDGRTADNQAAPPGREQLAPLLEQLPGATQAAADPTVALAGLAAARAAAAYIERAERDLIQAARHGGATWQQIAAALGIKTRTGAQKRHADLSRRWPRPPAEDTAVPEAPPQRRPDPAPPPPAPGAASARRSAGPAAPRPASPAPAPPARKPGTGTRHPPDPEITPAIIGNGQYDIVKAPGHADTRAWHVLVGGQRAGIVRPTWRGERSRHGWEAVTNAGTALPATGTGRITAAGNARTRDAAAVSLLNALLREQENQPRKRKQPSPA
jgi:hypothetical protein